MWPASKLEPSTRTTTPLRGGADYLRLPASRSSILSIAVVGCPAGLGTNAIVRNGAPSALRESSVAAACHVMGAEQDSRDVRSSASSAGHGPLLDHAYSGHAGVLAASHQERQ